METIRIAVGSKRAPKLDAVREALEAFGPLLHPKSKFEVKGFEVATGVNHTPRSRAELMVGARGRCESLMKLRTARPGTRYFVGLEGGLDVMQENYNDDSRRLFSSRAGHSCVMQTAGVSTADLGRFCCRRRSQPKCWTAAASFLRPSRHTRASEGSAIRKAPGEF